MHVYTCVCVSADYCDHVVLVTALCALASFPYHMMWSGNETGHDHVTITPPCRFVAAHFVARRLIYPGSLSVLNLVCGENLASLGGGDGLNFGDLTFDPLGMLVHAYACASLQVGNASTHLSGVYLVAILCHVYILSVHACVCTCMYMYSLDSDYIHVHYIVLACVLAAVF